MKGSLALSTILLLALQGPVGAAANSHRPPAVSNPVPPTITGVVPLPDYAPPVPRQPPIKLQGGELGPPPPTFDWPDQPASTAVRRRLMRLRGRADILLYAEGLKDSFDLPLYKELGFNAVVVDVPWLDGMSYSNADALIRSARLRQINLGVILQFHPGQPPSSLKLRVDSADPDYVKAARQYLEDAAKHFRDMSGIDAMLFEDDAEQHVRTDDDGFRTALGARYGSMATLNGDWGSTFSSLDQITMQSAAQASVEEYDGLSIPGLLVGEYRAGAYGSLLRFWTNTLHEADPYPAIICGRQDQPRAAIQTPRACTGVVVSGEPPDLLPVDIGRRGGQFVTIVALTGADAQNTGKIQSYLMQCLIHGAGGVAFPSWESIAADRQIQLNIKPVLHDLSVQAVRLHDPAANCAVVYEPLAPGSPEGGYGAPFGYMLGPADQEPGLLLNVLSQGSIYGFPDVLSGADLSPALLSRYRVIFLPSVYVLPSGAVDALARFVTEGGVIVADLGLGLDDLHYLQAPWAPGLQSLFGLQGTTPIQFGRFEYPVRNHPTEPLGTPLWYPVLPKPELFPDLSHSSPQDLAANRAPFSGPRGFAQPMQGVDVGVFGINPPSKGADVVSGVFTRRLGQGYALFASYRLWSQWTSDNALFAAFHGDLLGRGASSFFENRPGAPLSVQFTPTSGGGFQILQSGSDATMGLVHLQDPGLSLRTGCILQGLPTQPPASIAYVSLQPQKPVSCEQIPVSLELTQGYVTVAVDEYGPQRIRLKICGTGSTVRSDKGQLHMVPGDAADAKLTIRDGEYHIAANSHHLAYIRDLEPGGNAPRVVLTADNDGVLMLSGHFRADSITIVPAPPAP
ncbi:MAG: hypothetical protein M3Y56_01415 [Armatimonadota bacterium]|nr:hypothetical protein [Armatimonadota bacterium]